jgi:hypothetical protein
LFLYQHSCLEGEPIHLPPMLGVRIHYALSEPHQKSRRIPPFSQTTPFELDSIAPTTRRITRITPPLGPQAHQEADTIRKTRFYDALGQEYGQKSIRKISLENGNAEGTGRLWAKQRESLGVRAYRSRRKSSSKLGRRSKITPEVCKMLTRSKRNYKLPVKKLAINP